MFIGERLPASRLRDMFLLIYLLSQEHLVMVDYGHLYKSILFTHILGEIMSNINRLLGFLNCFLNLKLQYRYHWSSSVTVRVRKCTRTARWRPGNKSTQSSIICPKCRAVWRESSRSKTLRRVSSNSGDFSVWDVPLAQN